MRFKNFTLLKLTLSFVLGILASHYFTIPFSYAILFSAISVFTLSLSYFIFKTKRQENTGLFGVLTLITFFNLGLLSYANALPENSNSYYGHRLTNEENTTVLKITKRLKANTFYEKYYAEVLSVNEKATNGTILIQKKKDSSNSYKVDAIVITTNDVIEIKPPRNPYQFNYKNFLKLQGVYHQVYIQNNKTIVLNNKTTSYNGWNDKLITLINTRLKKHDIDKDELAILNALLLGQKQDITNELYDNYTNSGAIHILAVSGLHIGIILFILQHLLAPFFNFKNGNVYKAIILIILLWSYAFLTGNSPSVTRATTMFTLVAIAINLKRKTPIYNTLVASILIILLFKPQFLFNVGFQLSYAAVFSIVAFQPLIARYIKSRFKAVNYVWNVFSVTLAAQFGIIPISLLYFHQFPSLFWLSNLVIIPFLPVILGLGILVIVLLLVNLNYDITHVFVKLLEYALRAMNAFLKWISSFENFIFKDIYFNLILVLSSLFVVVSLYKVWKTYSYKRLVVFLVSVIVLQLSFIGSRLKTNSNEFVIFHKTKTTYLAHKQQHNLTLFSDDLKKNYITKSYKVGSNINGILHDSIKPFHTINNKKILVIDSLAIYNLKTFKPDIILLRNSPKLNLERLLSKIQPTKIIADGSNYKSYVKRWEATCKNKKHLFHSTEKGAFVLKY